MYLPSPPFSPPFFPPPFLLAPATPLQFEDGVNLIYLMGLLENYYLPLFMYYPAPATTEDKVCGSVEKFI